MIIDTIKNIFLFHHFCLYCEGILMETFAPKKSCLLSMLFCVILSATASAHTLWINCTDYRPDFSSRSGAKTKIYMGWGHHFPVDSFV